MIGVEELQDAMRGRNEQLKSELRANRKIIAKAPEWMDAIRAHIDAAIKCFDVVGDPDVVVEWDPDDGRPYACVKVDVKTRRSEHMKAYQRYVRNISDVQYLSLIVLDVEDVDSL